MDKAAILELVSSRLASVEQRLTAACMRAGRYRSEVTLVAVTKALPMELSAMLPELGLNRLGESRPQELQRKAAALPATTEWHLIGHLQRNKIEATLPLVTLIHSVDSVRLINALEKEAQRQGRTVDVLLEVNVSGEASKQGFTPKEVRELRPLLETLERVRVGGLMTMAPMQASEDCRPTFVALRQLRDKVRESLAPLHELQHLSMGMSNDFEIAVEEGATMVRLGSVLFEGLTT